jgi:hypothetical protein
VPTGGRAGRPDLRVRFDPDVWELVNGSFVFVEQGQQSREKFLSSGQNVAIKGTTVGYYLFRRCAENRGPTDVLIAARRRRTASSDSLTFRGAAGVDRRARTTAPAIA